MKQSSLETNVGVVKVIRKSGLRRLTLRVRPNGLIQVSAPLIETDRTIKRFIEGRADWINKHLKKQKDQRYEPADGDLIGKLDTLRITTAGREGYKIKDSVINVALKSNWQPDSIEAQKQIRKAIIQSLRQQSKELLPARVESWAAQMGLKYDHLRFKNLKSRWGSYSSKSGSINLNISLLLLDDNLIDHVIIHELAHIKHTNHSKQFWRLLIEYDSNGRANSRKLAAHTPLAHS